MAKRIRFGVQTPPQNVTFQKLHEIWKLIDSLRFDTAWTFDHFFALGPDPSGPCFEGWISLTALMADTSHVQGGVLVTGNTYRHPAVLAKMGATLDHTSRGRLIMGIGAAWFELEHRAYGIPFGTVGERIRRLDEAVDVIKMLWTEKQVTFEGRYYQLKNAYCEPKPLQQPKPRIMIGGAGEKLMLRVVAKHADMWNTFGSPELFRQKVSILGEHCAAIGRNVDDIEISWAGAAFITESKQAKEAMVKEIARAFGRTPEEMEPATLIGSTTEVRERMQRFIDAGVTHFIVSAMPPFDEQSLRRLAEEIMPGYRS
jgi:F420-dependent oxidoreductase-like protein